MRTNLYVDSFNFYYGSLRGTPYKWLDMAALFRALLPKAKLGKIRVFSARVSARPSDPSQPIRQATYFRALQTLPNLSLHLGQFLSHPTSMPLVNPPPGGPATARVIKTEEKGSDVNLASYLLLDGFRADYEQAAVLSNDSDLTEPVRLVRDELRLPIQVLVPLRANSHPSRELTRAASGFKVIREAHLQASQFASSLSDAKGSFHKPATW